MSTTLARTRRSLHGVAELLLAGPQHAAHGRITLCPGPGGFGATHLPDLRVEGTEVVHGERRAALDGRTVAEVAHDLGLTPTDLGQVYHDGSGVTPDEVLRVDAEDAAVLSRAFALGQEALTRFAPDQTPVLWPEHFDLGISLEEVNYGVSPGDGYLDGPYAYVGPWTVPEGDFWNAPFGAARPLTDFEDAEALAGFFSEGRARAS